MADVLARLEARVAELEALLAAELTEELELPDYAEDACDIADRMGFNPQRWIDAEYTRRNTA
ncbi:hypothetical protein KBZ21_41790, partial [Streptomyces sp. A73]|nr:hypothetical protein [Streptomyces sp. A73]